MPKITREEQEKVYELFHNRIPTADEFKIWPEEKFISLMNFFLFFCDPLVPSRFSVDKMKMSAIKARYIENNDDVYWHEFIVRIDTELTVSFSSKLRSLFRAVSKFFRDNPEYLTSKIIAKCNEHPLLKDYISFYEKVKTKSGVEIIVPKVHEVNPGDIMDPRKTPSEPVEVIYQDAVHRATNLLRSMVNSISKKDINEMATKDKFDNVVKLINSLNGMRRGNNKSNIFIGLNVNKSSREELEGKLLEYTEQQDKNE